MSNRDLCISMLDDFTDAQLINVAAMLQTLKLSGNWGGFQECHIQSDWLLIYRIDGNDLYLTRTGTHSDLLGI